MNDSYDESRIRRALSGDFAEQWSKQQNESVDIIYSSHERLNDQSIEEWDMFLGRDIPVDQEQKREYLNKRRIEILGKIKHWFQDRKILFISQWDAESTYREELLYNPLLIENTSFMHDWNEIREKQLSQSIQLKSDPLSQYAILYHTEPMSVPDEKEFLSYYFNYFIKLGPDRSGRLEEVIGPMGSGKSNFLAWKAIRALQKGYVVFTNFSLKNVPQSYHSNWHEVHTLSRLFLETIQLTQNGYDDLIFWVLDEQGKTRGSTSLTKTTREGRWAKEILTMIRKFGVFLTRARQSADIPADQIDWINSMIEKSPDTPELVSVKYLDSGQTTEHYEFTIENMKHYFDTKDPATFEVDFDAELMNKWVAMQQEDGLDPVEAMNQYITRIIKLNKIQREKEEQKINELVGDSEATKRVVKVNPRSIMNLKPFRNENKNKKPQ